MTRYGHHGQNANTIKQRPYKLFKKNEVSHKHCVRYYLPKIRSRKLMTSGEDYNYDSRLDIGVPPINTIYDELLTKEGIDRFVDGIYNQ